MRNIVKPLQDVRVLELAGLAIAPHCGMILSDFGADVVRIDRKLTKPHYGTTALGRGKRSIQLDLKDQNDKKAFQHLASKADVLIEPFRPGVMESLGLGPSDLRSNSRLIYTRLTGWGQSGPRSNLAGHDINYIAQSGVLGMIVEPKSGRPIPPVNFLGDFAGGSVTAAMGIAMALYERERSGLGQVIDANVLEGAAYLSSFIWRLANIPDAWQDPPGSNMLDGASPFYQVYETKDGRWMAVGAIEAQFWRELLEILGLDPLMIPEQRDRSKWPELRELLTLKFAEQTQEYWIEQFDGSDACVSPVLDRTQSMEDPHNVARSMYTEDGMPNPSPRLSRTPGFAAATRSSSGDGSTLKAIEDVGW